MATKYWIGNAEDVAQVTNVADGLATWAAGTYTLTINDKTVTYVSGAGGASDVINGLVAAIAASSILEFQDITATADLSTPQLVLTSSTAGVPFTVTAGGPGTFAASTATTATGKNHLDNADNWDGGVAPVNGDDIVFENSTVSVLYGLTQTWRIASVTINATFSGEIGLPVANTAGYVEYRDRYLKLGDGTTTMTVSVGSGAGQQSALLLLDLSQMTATDVSVYGTGSSNQQEYPLELRNPLTGSDFDIYSGLVLIDADTAGVVSNLRVTPASTSQGEIRVQVDPTVTCGTVVCSGGTIWIGGSVTTSLNSTDGAQVTIAEAAAIPTVNVSDGGRVDWRSTGGISTQLNVYDQGVMDFSGNGQAKTVAACNVYNGGTLLDPLGIVTWTTGVDNPGGRLGKATLDLGLNKSYAVSAI